MNIRLWKPSNKTKKSSNLYKFEKFVSKRFNKNFNENFKKIHDWSVKNQGDFWSSVWDFSYVKGIKRNTKVKKIKNFFKNTFLPNSRLNFCENLLSKNTKEKAITFISENGYREIRNWNELNKNVKIFQIILKNLMINSTYFDHLLSKLFFEKLLILLEQYSLYKLRNKFQKQHLIS